MKVLLFVLALFAVVALNAVAQEEIVENSAGMNWTNIDQSQNVNWTDYSGIKQ